MRTPSRLARLLATALAPASLACGSGSGGSSDVEPVTPVITMPSEVSAGVGGYTASVPPQAGVTFGWTITGGTITAGQGTETVTFTAGTSGTVQLSCTATAGARHATGTASASVCALACAPDGRSVLGCRGAVVHACGATQACDAQATACVDACGAAASNRQSVGCDFYAVAMEILRTDWCLALHVVNASGVAAHLAVEYDPAAPLSIADFARVPSGTGPGLVLGAYDPAAGLAPGQDALLFLAGSTFVCPTGVAAAVPVGASLSGTGTGRAFHLTSDVPVAAYQVNPWDAASALTGASLLLPTSAWGTNYVAVAAAPASNAGVPSVNIVAREDDTGIQILPTAPVIGGGGVPSGPANATLTLTLNRGQQVQLSQAADLSGSIVASNKPVGVLAGGDCIQVPTGTPFCDHAEQMLPPIPALGHEYVGAMFRPRVAGDQGIWRIVGVVDGTALTWSPAIAGAPALLNAGQEAILATDVPFVVRSQDAAHPFILFLLMSGSEWSPLATPGYGDPDFVLVTPVGQFGTDVTFAANPTFPETDLVVVRARDATGALQDVVLQCAGALGDYEWTRVDLVRHDFAPQGSCTNGPQHAASLGPFAITVWGWGTPETTSGALLASYGYPAGLNLRPLNSVVLEPIPK